MTDSSVKQGYCGNCGEQVRVGAAFCVSCGESLSTPQQTVDHAPQPPSNATTGSPAGENAQERRRQTAASGVDFDYRDPLQSFINTTRDIALKPVGFFSGILRQGDYVNPLVFTLICVQIFAVLQGIVMFFGALGMGDTGGAFGSLILYTLLAPIAGALGVFVRAGVLHLLVLLLVKPQTTGFETTFRASTYSLMPVMLAWIPILGPIISGIWSTVLAILGIREGHSTSTGRAAAVVLIPVGVMALISIVLSVIVLVFVSAVFNSMGGY